MVLTTSKISEGSGGIKNPKQGNNGGQHAPPPSKKKAKR